VRTRPPRAAGPCKAVDAFVPEFDRVSPFDIYPAPDSRHPDDGYLIERHRMTRQELQALINVPGYSEENIRMVNSRSTVRADHRERIDSERADIEFHGETGRGDARREDRGAGVLGVGTGQDVAGLGP
jgi:hypothetical protein